MTTYLTLGPILFHWPAEQKRDFYYKIADEAPLNTVYLGEVICSKRSPFFDHYYNDVVERLTRADKRIVFCSLAEVMIPRERKMTQDLCNMDDYEIEANDTSALYHLRGRPHRIGQYFNVYNEDTMAYLAKNGATHFTLPAELPKESLKVLGNTAKKLNVSVEVQVFGRIGLALSARCYHARAHGRVKDNCQFVCENDPDGMTLKTLDHQDFLSVNGVQTLSHHYLCLHDVMQEMTDMGIQHFRLSPHKNDMVETARIFRAALDNKISADEAVQKLQKTGINTPFANGFYHKVKGYQFIHTG